MTVESNFVSGQVLTAAQLNAQFASAASQSDVVQILDGTATDAGTLTGAETAPISRGAGLLQTTLTKIAQWTVQIFNGFTSSASGAGSLPVSSTLNLIPIYPEFFGAKGDGTTNDTIALQSWLNALGAGAVGMLSPAKVYGFTNLTLPSPSPYAGTGSDPSRTYAIVLDGQNGVLKKIAAGTDAAYGIASVQWLNNVNGVNSPIHIHDLNIDLNGFATTAGLITQHWNSLFERMNVFNAAGHGHMQAGAVRNGTNVTSSLNNNNWVGCDFYANGGHGLYVNSPGLNNNADGILERCRAFDNAKANVNIEICSGWDFVDLHCWNFVVTQTDLGVTRFGATNATRWRGCEFDLDGNNLATPSCYVSGGTTSLAGVFIGCYFYSPCVLNNSQSFRVEYSLTGCQFKSAYLLLNTTFISVVSCGTLWFHATPVLSNVTTTSPNASSVISAADFWVTNKVTLNGQHLLTKGAVAPYSGGYSYVPILSHKYSTVASGASYAMGYADPLLTIFSTPLTANITYQLPLKANISDFQAPFVFQRQASATGAFNVVIQDVDTSATIAQLTTAGTVQNIFFDGTAWKIGGSGPL
jgi:hypothetical protein